MHQISVAQNTQIGQFQDIDLVQEDEEMILIHILDSKKVFWSNPLYESSFFLRIFVFFFSLFSMFSLHNVVVFHSREAPSLKLPRRKED